MYTPKTDLSTLEHDGLRAEVLSNHMSFKDFWRAVDPSLQCGYITRLWDSFLYTKSDATTPAEHFEWWMANKYHEDLEWWQNKLAL